MGKIFKFNQDVDTDQIIASQYLLFPTIDEMKTHTFESLDPDFAANVKPGDYVVASENFGCGSSREHAPIAIKESGISCVIASSFARIFYRNSINIGLAILECEEASKKIVDNDEVEVDFDNGIIKNITKNEIYKSEPFPEFIKNIINSNGLLNSIKNG